MSSPAKPSVRILRNYEIIMLVIALTMIIVVKFQKPIVKKVENAAQHSSKVTK